MSIVSASTHNNYLSVLTEHDVDLSNQLSPREKWMAAEYGENIYSYGTWNNCVEIAKKLILEVVQIYNKTSVDTMKTASTESEYDLTEHEKMIHERVIGLVLNSEDLPDQGDLTERLNTVFRECSSVYSEKEHFAYVDGKDHHIHIGDRFVCCRQSFF